MVINTYMLAVKRTTLLPINCYYGISVLAKMKPIPRYMVFSVYHPTLVISSDTCLNLFKVRELNIYKLAKSGTVGFYQRKKKGVYVFEDYILMATYSNECTVVIICDNCMYVCSKQ